MFHIHILNFFDFFCYYIYSLYFVIFIIVTKKNSISSLVVFKENSIRWVLISADAPGFSISIGKEKVNHVMFRFEKHLFFNALFADTIQNKSLRAISHREQRAVIMYEEKGGFFSAVKINKCHVHFHLPFVVGETKGTFVPEWLWNHG